MSEWKIPPRKKVATIACFTAPGQDPLYLIVFEEKRMSGERRYGFPCGSIDELLDPSAEACAKRALLEQCFDAPVIVLLKGLGHGIHSLRIEFSASLRGRTVRTPDEIRA